MTFCQTLARVNQKTCGKIIETGIMTFTESIIEQAAIDWLNVCTMIYEIIDGV